MTLAALTNIFRKRITEFRHQNRMSTAIYELINQMEIAIGLAELGMSKKRCITADEEIWFEPDWKMFVVFEKTEWDDLVDFYRDLAFKVRERNWFR